MALLLWFHVTTDRTYEYIFPYPLKILNIPDNLVIYEEIPEKIKVLVEGRGKSLIRLFLSQKEELKIDGSEFKAKEINYQIKLDQISLPSENLRVKQIVSPRTFKIKLDYLMKKKVNVTSQIVIQPDDDFLFSGEIKLQPQQVIVEGPRRFVRVISSVLTQPKVLEGVREPVSETVDLVQPRGFNVKYEPEKVNFFANVQKGARKEMKVKVTNLKSYSGKKIKVIPDHIILTLLGEEKRLDTLTPEDVEVTFDLRTSKGKHKFPPIIKLPPQIKLIDVIPDSVEVEIN